jgi:hydroxymethylglutaryl-CoA lyase
MGERAYVREVGLRDGLQSLAEVMPTEEKIAWIDAEHRAGVREIEVSSFVPPKLLPQLADAEAVVRHALTLPGLTVSALIPNLKGAERGLALGVHEMNFVLSVSEGHNQANVRRSTEESGADFRRVVALCQTAPEEKRPRVACGLATAFGCTIEGAVDEDRVRRIANEVAEAGADGIILADTVGYGQPAAVERVFRQVMADVAPLSVAGHFHDTRGLGLANVLAALNAGARAFDASLGVRDTFAVYEITGGYPTVLCTSFFPENYRPSANNDCDTHHFWSMHPGGGNWIFADGSVRFLEYQTNNILPALATRNGGEAVAAAN